MPRLPYAGVGRGTLPCLLLSLSCATAPAQHAPYSQQTAPTSKVVAQSTQGSADMHGQISGTVTDVQGALIVGAQVQLRSATGTTLQATVSDVAGHFVLRGVSAGAFTVTVSAPGFTPASAPASLLAGQHFELQPLTLQMASVEVTVNAVATPGELAVEELHVEEHQRLIGLFPNFFVSYNWAAPPMSRRQKFTLAWRNATDPGNLFLVGTTAGIQQADNAFPGYHQGAAGYGKRYGADLGNLVSGTFLGGAILPVLFHQDPRYFYKGTGTIRSRVLYALSTAVICRGDNGHRQPAFASVLGDLSAGAISNLYYAPSDRQGATLTFENGIIGVGGDALNNLFQEFVLRRFTPKTQKKFP